MKLFNKMKLKIARCDFVGGMERGNCQSISLTLSIGNPKNVRSLAAHATLPETLILSPAAGHIGLNK